MQQKATHQVCYNLQWGTIPLCHDLQLVWQVGCNQFALVERVMLDYFPLQPFQVYALWLLGCMVNHYRLCHFHCCPFWVLQRTAIV